MQWLLIMLALEKHVLTLKLEMCFYVRRLDVFMVGINPCHRTVYLTFPWLLVCVFVICDFFFPACDDTCRESVLDPSNGLLVCPISGHCFDRLLLPFEEEETDPVSKIISISFFMNCRPLCHLSLKLTSVMAKLFYLIRCIHFGNKIYLSSQVKRHSSYGFC